MTSSSDCASSQSNQPQTLIFACSGAADVGEISDRAARQLTRLGKGRMFCLAGVAGGIGGIMKTTKSAKIILAIDGCPINCVKACLEQAGFTDFAHVQLADCGFTKGQSPATGMNVDQAVAACSNALSGKTTGG